MPRWLISVPVWGERYVELFCAATLPAIERAIVHLGLDAHLVVHTDQPRRIRDGATEIRIEDRPVPAGARDFDCLSQAHREVLHMGCRDDRVALLTADMVPSVSTLALCEEVFQADRSKFLVMCCGIRAVQEGPLPPTGNSRAMLAWAWAYRHPITEQCLYPGGLSADLSRVYFRDRHSVVARLALPHPLAVRLDGRALPFAPTVDASLFQNFHEAEIHIVTNPDDLAVVELSPRDKGLQLAGSTIEDRVGLAQFVLNDRMQRWAANHRVLIRGSISPEVFGIEGEPEPPIDCEVMRKVMR